jgi:hypothetical protein
LRVWCFPVVIVPGVVASAFATAFFALRLILTLVLVRILVPGGALLLLSRLPLPLVALPVLALRLSLLALGLCAGCSSFGTSLPAFLLFLLFGAVEAVDAVLAHHVLIVRLFFQRFVFHCNNDLTRFITGLVHFDDLLHAVNGNSDERVGLIGVGEVHNSLEDICFLVEGEPFLRLEPDVGIWKIFYSIEIAVQLIVQAAFQLSALACQL